MSLEFTLNCIEHSENEFAKELKDEIVDWNNVSSVIFSFIECKPINIVVLGFGKTGKTTFINTLLGKNYEIEIYKPTLDVNFNFLEINGQCINVIDFSSTQIYNSKIVDYKTIDGIILIMRDDLEYHFIIEWYRNIVRKKGTDIAKILIRNRKFYSIYDSENDEYYNSTTIDVKNKDEVKTVFNDFLRVVNSF